MGDVIAHRGPDDHRYYFWSPEGGHEVYQHHIEEAAVIPSVGFAHRRLSIVDINSGHQPMPNEDGTVWICYNGEVYNHRSLRQTLRDAGHQFVTQCDTEAIIHAYEQYGCDSVEKLNGIFAFALWDSRRQTMFLARDPFGVKPLYYTIHDGALIFASEIKAILQVPGVPRLADRLAITEHFTFQNTFGDRTFFEGIHLLPPGYWLLCDRDGTVTVQPYWRMQYDEGNSLLRPVAEIADGLRVRFESAVDSQLMSEVPLGTFLSGGMDTGSISAVAARKIPDMHTFTCGFALPSDADPLEQYFDESEVSFDLAHLIGTQHHEIRLNSSHNFVSLPWVTWALDEPRLGISYQNWYTNKLVRRHVTVVLGGSGGDELFAGYPWRHSAILGETDPDRWNEIYFQQWERLVDGMQRPLFFSEDFKRRTAGFEPFDSFKQVLGDTQITDPLNRALYFDAQTFLHGLLVVEDKLSMAHSVETRVPFLDRDLVDYVLTIPSALKLYNSTSKYILKQAMASLLPQDTLVRRKQGFTPPDASWYRGPLRPQVESLLLSKRSLERDYFQPDTIHCIVQEHMTGQRNHRFLLWSLMVFEWWNRLFIDGEPLPVDMPAAVETAHT
jgi:asparagine synthase (glutamine-hydrolysing)